MYVTDARSWLDLKNQPHEVDVSGNWFSDLWGNGEMVQNGNRIVGRIGDYQIEGSVSGKDVYLLLNYEGVVYYTVHLTAVSENSLSGQYSEDTFVDQDYYKYPIRLTGQLKFLNAPRTTTNTATPSDSIMIKWTVQSEPEAAHVFWKVVSSDPSVSATENKYIGDTPIQDSRFIRINGLTAENAASVFLQLEVSKKGYHTITTNFDCQSLLIEKEISAMFEMVRAK